MIDMYWSILAVSSLVLYSYRCFAVFCKEIGEYFTSIGTYSLGLAEWDETVEKLITHVS